jgi:ribosomal protein S7
MMATGTIRVAKSVQILTYIPEDFAWKIKSKRLQYTAKKTRKRKGKKANSTDNPTTQAVTTQTKILERVLPVAPPKSVREGEMPVTDKVPEPVKLSAQRRRTDHEWSTESEQDASLRQYLQKRQQKLLEEAATQQAVQLARKEELEKMAEAMKLPSSPPVPETAPSVTVPKRVPPPEQVGTRKSERQKSRAERKVLLGLKRSTNSRIREAYKVCKLSVKQGLQGEHSQESKEAILSEIQNMLQYKVGHYVKQADVPRDKLRNILQSFMFLKHKTLPDGTYDKTKARLVGNGASQKAHMYDMVSSSTVALASVFMLMNIASNIKAKITTYDIKGAFLNAEFTPEDEVTYIRINKEVAQLWIEQDPSSIPFLDEKGTLLLELDKFIYGLKQSPLKFQQHLTRALTALGYVQTTQDECIYVKHDGRDYSILSTHVDDIMQVATAERFYEELKQGLIAQYGDITTSEDGSAYLGMSIERHPDRRQVKVSQRGLIDKILERYPKEPGDRQKYYSPASDDLFDVAGDKEAVECTEGQKHEFLSVLMSLMYCARLTRPDILMPVTFLASRAHCTTDKDVSHLMRIVRYLETSKERCIVINCESLQIRCNCDASYAVHSPADSAYGHTGYVIGFGEGMSYVHSRSGKQKVASTSSTDAEIIALCEALKTCLWLRTLLAELRITELQEIVVYQDNQSAMLLGTVNTTPKRSKHMLPKLTYVRSQTLSGAVRLEHMGTTEMTADVLSKPLHGELFFKHITGLMGKPWSTESDPSTRKGTSTQKGTSPLSYPTSTTDEGPRHNPGNGFETRPGKRPDSEQRNERECKRSKT